MHSVQRWANVALTEDRLVDGRKIWPPPFPGMRQLRTTGASQRGRMRGEAVPPNGLRNQRSGSERGWAAIDRSVLHSLPLRWETRPAGETRADGGGRDLTVGRMGRGGAGRTGAPVDQGIAMFACGAPECSGDGE